MAAPVAKGPSEPHALLMHRLQRQCRGPKGRVDSLSGTCAASRRGRIVGQRAY